MRRPALPIDERARADAAADLDDHHLRVLNERADASEDAEQRGAWMDFDDLLEELGFL